MKGMIQVWLSGARDCVAGLYKRSGRMNGFIIDEKEWRKFSSDQRELFTYRLLQELYRRSKTQIITNTIASVIGGVIGGGATVLTIWQCIKPAL
jgi:hypothetical protein